MSLLLPGHLVDEYDDGIVHDITVAQRFNALLKELDEQLCCFWVKEGATSFTNPGRWHVGRVHPHNVELNTYWCIQNDDGSYCVPSDVHLEALKRIDTFTGQRTYSQIENARTTKQLARSKAFEEKRREFRESLEDRISFLYDPKVLITGPMKDKLNLIPPAPRSAA